MSEQKLCSPLLTIDDRIEELEMILAGVMMEVDQWCSRDDYELGEVERAKSANERIFNLLRKKDLLIKDLKTKINCAEDIIEELQQDLYNAHVTIEELMEETKLSEPIIWDIPNYEED